VCYRPAGYLSTSRSNKFASNRMIGCIDIVKEEFDRLLISFQVRFEKILSDKVKIRRRSGGYLFPSPG